jgi:hypothetical protein
VRAVLAEDAAVVACGVRVLAQLRQVGEVEQVHGLGHAGEHAAQDGLLRDRAAGVRRRAVERLRLPHTRRLRRRAPILPPARRVIYSCMNLSAITYEINKNPDTYL